MNKPSNLIIKLIVDKFYVCILYSIAYCLLWYGYYVYIVPVFGYTGFIWHPIREKVIEGTLLLCVVLAFMPTRFSKPSDFILHLQLLFPILPMIVMYGAANEPRAFIYYTIIAFLLIMLVARSVKIKAFRMSGIDPVFLQKILLTISFVYVLSIIAFGGLRYLNFDLLRVYEFRSVSASNLPGIYGYVSPMVSKVILPFSLLLSVINRNRIFVLLTFACCILAYALTSHKATLFYPLAVLLLYFIMRRGNAIRMLLITYIGIIVITLLNYMHDGENIMLGALFFRGMYFIPAHLNYLYYDFFSVHSFVLWAQSKISFGLGNYSYSIDVPHLIGYEFFSDILIGANTGWIGSGYMQFGFIGMMVYAFIIGLLISLLNAYSKRIDKRVVVAITTAPLLAVILSSDLPTAFLTHGVILSLILFSIFQVPEEKCSMQNRSYLRRTLRWK